VVDPRLRRQEPSRLQGDLGLGAKPFGETAPRPVLRAAHQAGAERVALDVSAGAHQVARAVDRNGSIPSLIDRSVTSGIATLVPAHGMGSRYPMHEADHPFRSRGLEHQVPVVREHAERDQAHGEALEPFLQYAKKGPIILRAPEDRRLAHTAVQDVKEGRIETGPLQSGHRKASSV
jgi:hypothetical protein